MYLNIIIAVALLIQHHRLIGVTLPLAIYHVLVVVCPGVQSHGDPEKYFPILPVLLGQVIIGLPFLPTPLNDDVIWNIFYPSLPDETSLLGGTWPVMLATAF